MCEVEKSIGRQIKRSGSFHCRGHRVVFFGKTLCSLSTQVYTDTSHVLGQPVKNAEGNLLWTRKHPCFANRYRTLVKKQTTTYNRKINGTQMIKLLF